MFNILSALSILALMFFAVVQVVGRKVFNAPIFGYIDWVEQVMVIFAFIGVAYCQREGGHVRMELLIRNFRKRLLWLVEVIGISIGLFIIGILIFSGSLYALSFTGARWLGALTPIGGVSLILGWVCLAISAIHNNNLI